MNDDFKPTGTCFEDCTLEFTRMLTENRELWHDPTFCLVHGICEGDDTVPRHSHAWIEHGFSVYAPGILRGMKGFATVARGEFYRAYKVTDEVTRYTPREALLVARLNGDRPPPWEERYRRLTKDYKKSRE